MPDRKKTYTIKIQYQAEDDVFLSTCDDMPGLMVQTDTADEALSLAPQLAHDLLDLDPNLPAANEVRFEFDVKESENG